MTSIPAKSPLPYFISTPYIDAYQHDWEPEHPKITYDEFVKKMTAQAYQWGEQGIGRAVTMGASPFPKHGDDYVFAFGTLGGKKYLALTPGTDSIRVVEVDYIPNEWDVT